MRLPFVVEDALAFAARHPVGHLDEPTRRRLLTQLTASAPGWQVLLDGDVVAGLVRVSVENASGEVRVLGRSPSHRGRGLGRLLIDHGLRLLTAAGVGAVTLEVAATNERALALYRAFDFEVVERTPVFAAVL